IRRFKANTVNIQRQAIRILLYPDNGVIAVGLVNTDRARRPHSMRVQKDHDLSNDFLHLPGLDDPLLAFGTNAIEVGQPLRCLLNDVEYLLPKGLDQLFGKVWPNAFDHARAEVLFNTFEGAGWDHTQRLGLELQAMRPVRHPSALPFNILTWGDGRRRPHDRDQVAVPPDLDPEDTEAGLLTMEGDALDRTSQLFCGMGARRWRCESIHRLLTSLSRGHIQEPLWTRHTEESHALYSWKDVYTESLLHT